jgi:hypothetical protein
MMALFETPFSPVADAVESTAVEWILSYLIWFYQDPVPVRLALFRERGIVCGESKWRQENSISAMVSVCSIVLDPFVIKMREMRPSHPFG